MSEQDNSLRNFDSTNDQKLDVAVIRAEERTDIAFGGDQETEDYLPSGSFRLLKPGVFFNQDEFVNITGEEESVQADRPDDLTDVWTTYSNRWPSINSSCLAPLIAYRDQTTGTLDSKISPQCVDGGTYKEIEFGNLIRTNIDGFTGHSGGAMMHRVTYKPPNTDAYDTIRGSLEPTGIIQGVRAGKEQRRSWGSTTENSSELYTSVTAATDDVVEWGNRDKDWRCENPGNQGDCDPFHPVPHQPATEYGFECEKDVCDRIPTYKMVPNGPWDDPPSREEVPLEPMGTSPPEGDEGDSRPTYGRTCVYPGSHTFAWQSSLADWPVTGLGLMTGIVASANTHGLQPDTRVANFSGVCAPWSAASYTDNWRFLSLLDHLDPDLEGRFQMAGGDLDGTDGFAFGSGRLRDILTRVYETRRRPGEAEPYVRPPSFKSCPPNYYLQGVKVLYREKDGPPVLAGITELLCINTKQERDQMERRAGAAATAKQDRYDDYSMYGEHFSIGQHLGKPHNKNIPVNNVEVDAVNEDDNAATLTCEQSEHEGRLDDSYRWMVGGIAKARDSQGRIRDFHLICVPGPVEK